MLKQYTCPLNPSHGALNLSKYTPGAYRCKVCNALFDRDLDLEKNSASLLTHDSQKKIYQNLLANNECKIPLGFGRSQIIKQFIKDHPKSLVILGSKMMVSQFKGLDNVVSYYQYNRTNLNLFEEILVDETSFGMHSLQRRSLIDNILNHKSQKEVFLIR